ncbi:alpha/beta fold hydrolase [Terrabacter terrigena]|uniref:Alpha/beta fold hydrolase n=1 Tax=Terrabacter terrigena TaxID=574718 RepID=A0ABW3N0M2_9MICO
MAALLLHERRWGRPGDAPTVVLVHATGETGADWAAVAGALAADRLVVAVDLRGHGSSPWPGSYALDELADDLVATVERLVAADPAGRPVDLVAHSLGGLVAVLLAGRRPGLVRRLVLEDVPVPHPRDPRQPTPPEGELAFDWEAVTQVRAQIDAPDPRWPERVARICAPTLVVWGGPSSPIPAAHVQEMADSVVDGRLQRIDAGHLVHAHEPDAFTAAAREFLDEPR